MKYSVNSVWENKDVYDIVVVGAGHAGCEAALASARLGFKTIMFTVSVDSIALMPCNPNIGGSSKGHLVREVDALGAHLFSQKCSIAQKDRQYIPFVRKQIKQSIRKKCAEFFKTRKIWI